ncbi:MAG: exodeoxyribonuclease VII large subunit [Lactobacillaceae bacterium]|jgi:exodeoxyribonuclease VII large subunit|nr:exodeoxyribonuclease VII large subunit [Lactobacillaceae bacterium]
MQEIELREFTVSEISFEIKRYVENTFSLVRVKGEIFGAKKADSGHWYLSLKDENAVLSAVCWKGVASRFNFNPEDGLEVIATGKITTFAGKSSYQLVIEQMEVAGAGALLKLLEERKQKFAAEGLFDQAHKKKIPFLPKTIGVVTSASGAVIRDIIHRVRDRFPSHILLWPTPVQGEGAALSIAAAIDGFNNLPQKPDVLIVARGGGSLEDLWAFNEEVVIRSVFNSEIPIISAVGHETDTMLIDYAADVRAPTPTGAAEFAVPVRMELLNQTSSFGARMASSIMRFIGERKNYLTGLARGIPNLSQILLENQQKLDDRIERLNISFKSFIQNKQNQITLTRLSPYYISNIFEKKKENLNNLNIRLENVSISSVLKRGFAWITGKSGKTIYNTDQAQNNQFLNIQFIDGTVKTKVVNKKDELQADLFDN